MNGLLNILNQPLSMGGMVLVAVLVLNVKVRRNEKDIAELKKNCDDRQEFCLNYFAKDSKKGGE